MPAWAIAGSSAASALLGERAASAEEDAAARAQAQSQQQFDLQWGAQAPYRAAGVNALAGMAGLTGGADPRIAAFQGQQQDLVNKFRKQVNANTASEVFTSLAKQFGVEKWQDVTDEQILETLSTPEGMAKLKPQWAKSFSALSQEAKGLTQNLAAIQDQPSQTPEQMLAADPSVGFRRQQGQEAVQNYLSGTGQRLGGSALKALEDYGQNFASQEYGNVFGRQAQLAGYGPPATQTPANQIPSYIAAGGDAAANRYSAYNQAIQGGIQNYLSYDAAKQFQPTQYSTDYSQPMTTTNY